MTKMQNTLESNIIYIYQDVPYYIFNIYSLSFHFLGLLP